MPEPGWTALADLVLAVHAAIAASVVLGLFAIVVGNLRGWRWVNDGWFRAAHLAAIAIVAAESWLGIPCPLTTLETSLRARAGGTTYAGGFIEHWVRRALFFDGPAWAFTLAYTAFGLAVLSSWWRWPPRRRG